MFHSVEWCMYVWCGFWHYKAIFTCTVKVYIFFVHIKKLKSMTCDLTFTPIRHNITTSDWWSEWHIISVIFISLSWHLLVGGICCEHFVLRVDELELKLLKKFMSDLIDEVSEYTVHNSLLCVGLHSHRPVRVPMLTRVQCRKHQQWAHKHESWTMERWKKVAWSDESRGF